MNNLIILPEIVLEHIFSFLSYDNIAQNRVVCRKFNDVGSKMLNKGYYAADRFHGRTLKSIKARLPRRESERRAHPLARQCDILIAIETRLSMLAMTFTKWMDAKLCCFIPGKVIDEIMRVLRCVANNPNPPRAHEILQELRDISSMAMEHFDEKILPSLRLNLGSSNHFHQMCKGAGGLLVGSSRTDDELAALVAKKRTSHDGKDEDGPTITISVAEFNKLLIKEAVNSKKLKAQSELLTKQGNEISELRKHVEEWEAKLRDLTTNLIKSKDLPSNSSTTTPKSTVSTPIVPCQDSRKRRISGGNTAAASKKRKQAAFVNSSRLLRRHTRTSNNNRGVTKN